MHGVYPKPEINLQFLVNAFGLSISLWVKGGGRGSGYAAGSVEVGGEGGDELGSSVARYRLGEPEVADPVIDEESGEVS